MDWRKHHWQREHNPDGLSCPVFLVGSQRSGTNMTVKNLARSWEIELYNESNPKAFRDYHLLNPGVIAQLVEASHARVVVFKPILDTYRAHHLLEQFPQARVLFIFRHFDDVVNSMLRVFYKDPAQNYLKKWIESGCEPQKRFRAVDRPVPVETLTLLQDAFRRELDESSFTALYWYLQSCFYFDLELDCDPRVKLINYESLVRHPASGFENICDFIGIRYTPDMHEHVHDLSLRKHEPPQIDPAVREACQNLWERLCQVRPDSYALAER